MRQTTIIFTSRDKYFAELNEFYAFSQSVSGHITAMALILGHNYVN